MIWDIQTIAYVGPSQTVGIPHVIVVPGSGKNLAQKSIVYLSGLTVHPELNGVQSVILDSVGDIILYPPPILDGKPFWNQVLETGTVRAPDQPGITLVFDLMDYSGAEIGSATQPAYLRIVLAGFGAVLPRVDGTAMIGKVVSWPGDIPYLGAGPQQVNLWGNDVITPLGTYYCISVLDDKKNVIQSGEYQFTGRQFIDLSQVVPMAPSPGWVNTAGIITVNFQPNLILPGTGSQMSIYEVTLTGDVTSNTFASLTPGIIIFEIHQDSVGNHNWIWPAIVQGGEQISLAPFSVSTQQFLYDGVAVRALGGGGGSGGGGIQSINNDFTPAQQIIGAGTVTVSTTNGVTTIAVGSGGPVTASSLTFNPSTVIGGNPSTGTVFLTGPAPAGGALVGLTNSEAILIDIPTSVTVPAGASSATFPVITVPVGSDTAVNVTATYGGMGVGATITLAPASSGALVSITLNPTTVQGGNPSTATVTLSSNTGPQGALVSLSSSDTSVAQVPTGGVFVLAGTSSATFTVTTTAISGSSSATISATYGNTQTAVLTVTAGSGVVLTALTLNPSSIVAGQSTTGTVTISGPAPAPGVVVTLQTSSGLVTAPPTVTIPTGQTSATFTVDTSSTIGSLVTESVQGTYAGVTVGFTLIIQPLSDQWIYGGPGVTAGGTVVGIVGNNQVGLSTGDVLDPLKNGAEQVGDTWTFGVNNEYVYLLLIGGSHTFTDAGTGFPYAMNPPVASDLGGRAMFLYQSTNALFGTTRPKIAT